MKTFAAIQKNNAEFMIVFGLGHSPADALTDAAKHADFLHGLSVVELSEAQAARAWDGVTSLEVEAANLQPIA